MRSLHALTAALLLGFVGVGIAEEPQPLTNGTFERWATPTAGSELPVGWQALEGARMGNGGTSRVRRGTEGGVRLEGDSTTRVWQMLDQRASLPADATCRLTFEARLVTARLDPGQNDNAYVGMRLLPVGPGGTRPIRYAIDTISRATWTPGSCVFRVDGAEPHVTAFLSKTGALEVRKLALEVLKPEQAFDVLVEQVGRYYSFLELKKPELKGLDWYTHAAAFKPRALAAAINPVDALAPDAALVSVFTDLLAPLKDLHISIKRRNGQIEYPYVPSYRANVEMKALKEALGEMRLAGRAGYTARLAGGVGYVACTSLQGTDDTHAKLRELLGGLLDAPGLVIDLRGNSGGDEARAQALMGMLIDRPVVYARRKLRNGPAPGDFTPLFDAVLQPAPGAKRYAGPIVVLLGPGCISSGEGMAQMLDALPNVRTVGLPTQGASGSPQPAPLPNGMEVRFPRWVNVQLDGTLLEGRGVQPDLVVPHEGPGDATLAAGLGDLSRRLAASKDAAR